MVVQTRYQTRDKGFYAIQSLDRAIDILETFSSGTAELGVAEIAARVDLPRATVHRLLAALTHRHMLTQDNATGKYYLGLKLFELGSLVGAAFDVKRVAHPFLEDLVRQVGETAHLVVLDGVDLVFVDKVESENPFRMVSQIGGRVPAHRSGSGKALLAALSDAELDRRFAEAPPTHFQGQGIQSLAELKKHLALVRVQGFAIDDQETQVGLRCVGSAIRDHMGTAIAGVSISGPIVRVSDERVPELARLLCSTAAAISRSLGFRGVTSDRS